MKALQDLQPHYENLLSLTGVPDLEKVRRGDQVVVWHTVAVAITEDKPE